MSRIVGIDFGKARIGLAISDENQRIAFPLTTIRTAKDPMQTAKLIAHTLASYPQIAAIVIGLPLLLSGKEGEMAFAVKNFARILETVLPFPIIFWDERLTSSGVERTLQDMNVSRKKRAILSDTLSAVSILQNYLDAQSI